MSEAPDYRRKLDINQIILRQMDRANEHGSLDYETSIIQKMNNLPMASRAWVADNDSRYTKEELTLLYRKYSKVKMGSKTSPVLFNPRNPVKRLKDGSVDWDDPNILSPVLKMVKKVDYTKLDAVIMEAYERAGLTFITDNIEQDAGDTEEHLIKRARTPWTIAHIIPHLTKEDLDSLEEMMKEAYNKFELQDTKGKG